MRIRWIRIWIRNTDWRTALLQEEVEKGDSGFCLPYEMEKGKMKDPGTGNSYSVKMQFNSEEQWTKAMKYMLTNLKWGLAWVTSKYTKQDAEKWILPPSISQLICDLYCQGHTKFCK